MTTLRLKQELYSFAHTFWSCVLLALVLGGIGGTIYKVISPEGWLAQMFGRSLSAGAAALGSMAPTVRRLRTAEAFVRGQRLTPPVVREAVALLSKDVSPIDDVRSNADYRLAVSRNLLLRFLEGVRS